jgi:hypothetical protein
MHASNRSAFGCNRKIAANVTGGFANYSRVFFCSFSAMLALVVGLSIVYWRQIIAIPDEADPGWYRDFGGRATPEIHDQDIFYHNIGPSVASAKAADIVLLGPSFSTYAFDRERLRQFSATSGLKVYNMSFLGIRSGEFSRRILTRWSIRAPLWLINVDDQIIHFFSRETVLTIGSKAEPIRTLRVSRLRGFLSAVSRTVRWRLEDWEAERRDGRKTRNGLYRSIATGDINLDVVPRYVANDNPFLKISRDPNCHVSDETIEIGRQFLKDIGGTVVFTLVPHSQYCPLQAQELAKALGVELILPPSDGYTTVDGGGHLDKRSATIFTDFVMSRLLETKAYNRTFETTSNDKKGG